MTSPPKDLFSRLADRGEEVLSKVGEPPGAAKMVELINSTRERIDDLQKRVMGLENLERRLDELEKRVDRLGEPAGAKPPKKAAPKKPPARTPPPGASGS
jgi:hypothetical protein